MDPNRNEFLWVEKYRPKRIDECILPESLKKTFSDIIKSGEVPNLLFAGTSGTGKTTVARALCNELDLDYLLVNASLEPNIETLRTKISHFASTVSLQGGYKVVILDEADYLNANSVQPALRGFIEKFSNNCRFIFTCNFKHRLIEPIHSRCSVYEFAIPNKEKPKLASIFFSRLCTILDKEGIEYDKPVIVSLIENHFPDWRRTLNETQRYSIGGKIDSGILINTADQSITALIEVLKDKNFRKMRKWVMDNSDIGSATIYRKLYDGVTEYLKPNSIPQVILILAQYQYYESFVVDRELNMVACLVEIMSSAEFR